MLDQVLQTIESRRADSIAALKEWLAIPSISTKPEHAPDMLRAATWLADQLTFAGLDVSVMQTDGAPAVVAKNKHQKGRPTVLLYGHYDVQPAEPLELWTTPPFAPNIRKDENGFDAIYARGAADDKGQVWCHVEAILAWQAHTGVPVNLTLLIEGEEEIGSKNLEAFIRKHQDALRADICLVSDTDQFARGIPAICYGLRGLVYEEVFITGASHDLHSGGFGGAVPNPANVLCEVLGSLHDADGRVNIPGFYDDVQPLSDEERALWQKLPHDDEKFAKQIGLPYLNGESGYSTLERIWCRPTLDINGLTAGYQGQGAKTVIGSNASAKVSMRLVPKQNPRKVREQFRAAVESRLPKNVKVEFKAHGGAGAIVTPRDSAAVKRVAEALHQGFGVEPVYVRSGGVIGAVEQLHRVLGIDSILIGFGLPDDRAHSPNEKMDVESFQRGCTTAARIYGALADL